MKKKLLNLVVCMMLFNGIGTISLLEASVVGFDDLNFSYNQGIPRVYNDLSWNNFYVFSQDYFANSYNFNYSMPSGDIGAYNGYKRSASINSDVPFDFNGASFTHMTYYEGVGPEITITGYLNGIIIDTVSMTLPGNHFEWLQANFQGIDQLTFQSSDYWVMDNFTINATVPIPGAIWLFGSGLAVFAGVRRKFKK